MERTEEFEKIGLNALSVPEPASSAVEGW